MCDWIDNEIADIQESDIQAPKHTSNEFSTIVPGATVSVRLQKVHARAEQLRKHIETIFAENGLISYGEDGEIDMVIEPPTHVIRQVHPFILRATALENVICENLMAEHNLWEHVSVIIGGGWEVYYQTHEQEKAFQRMVQQSFGDEYDFMDEDLDVPESFDPGLN